MQQGSNGMGCEWSSPTDVQLLEGPEYIVVVVGNWKSGMRY